MHKVTFSFVSATLFITILTKKILSLLLLKTTEVGIPFQGLTEDLAYKKTFLLNKFP